MIIVTNGTQNGQFNSLVFIVALQKPSRFEQHIN
jgi:hypothetical protein